MSIDVQAELARLGFPFPFSGGDDADSPKEEGDPKPEDTEDEVEYSDKQAADIRRKRKAWEKAAADKAKTDLQAELDRKRQKDEETEQQRKAEEKGQYEEAKQALEQRATDAEQSLQSVTAERDALLDLVKADVETSWKEIPDEVKEAYDGEEDDVLAKKRHIVKNAKIIARLTDKKSPRGNGFDPKPGDKQTDIDTEIAKARRRMGGI